MSLFSIQIYYRFTRNRERTLAFFLLITAGLLLTGCGKGRDAEEFPLPGRMKVVSATPVGSIHLGINLIQGGTFSEWAEAAPASKGFLPPADSSSTISRGQIPDSQQGYVLQKWSRTGESDPETCFRTEILSLAPDTEYELAVRAASHGGVIASLDAWEFGPDSSSLLSGGIIHLMETQNILKEYRGTFKTRTGGPTVIAVRAHQVNAAGGSISWYEWLLTKKNSATQ